MCSYKSGFYTLEDLEFYYHAIFGMMKFSEEFKEQFVPHYYENAYDHFTSPVMTAPGEVGLFSWGLIPWFTKALDQALMIRNQTVNAKSEEMFEKPSFRDSLKDHRRCIIPATGFFEWQWADPDAKKTEKQPYFIQTKNKLFSFAGIWSTWNDKVHNTDVHTYTILTCEANPLMRGIHNSKKRMPVILPDAYLKDWLNPNLSKDDVLALCKPYDDSMMEAWPVDKRIGNPKLLSSEKDVADILTKVDPFSNPVPEPAERGGSIKAKKIKGDPGQGSLF